MRFSIRRRGEEGSIAVTMSVAFIATALSAALLTTVYREIKVSRRAGDAANALQVADAGINDAIKSLRDAVGTVGECDGWSSLPGFRRTSTIAGGTYEYCAARDADSLGRPVWHIDAVGTDATGVKRRLRSDAVSTPLFPNAINVLATGSFSSGFSVDSFKDEANRCTKKGKIGTNDPAHFSFGNHGNNSSENCQNNPNGTWPHPPDGCIAYSDDGTAGFSASQLGSGQCPPANTSKESPKITATVATDSILADFPASGPKPGDDFVCNASTPLQAGKTYWYGSVTLGVGCTITGNATMADPVEIFVADTLTIAGGQGNGNNPNEINPPPNSATVCGPTHTQTYRYYCPGWSGALQIYVSGTKVTFNGNHSRFWGVITAPNATASWSGGGGSQYEIWGSMTAGSISGAVQAKWHYDENLGAITSGAFFGSNWREEPLCKVPATAPATTTIGGCSVS
jgi:hypothetical protein